MGANDFFAPLDIIGDAGIESVVKKLAQHGLYNDVNKANEYAGKTFHFTNNIGKGAYAKNNSGTDFCFVKREILFKSVGDGFSHVRKHSIERTVVVWQDSILTSEVGIYICA